MQTGVFYIDTFTSTKFTGNPTAICLVKNKMADETMLSIAHEFNLPVTGFIQKETSHYSTRYFTPLTEIPACGHATLAAAAVVFGEEGTSIVQFKTGTQLLIKAGLSGDTVTMSYPRYSLQSCVPSEEILKSLGLIAYRSAGLCRQLETLFIELDDPALLRKLTPDYEALTKGDDFIKEVVITSFSDDAKYDFLLRSFCPWIGIDEDPVTGSVHSALTPFWSEKLNKTTMTAFQASARGGEVFVKTLEHHVELGGKCVIILKGILTS
ncbi:MAG: PhzF family phenazine biosynthesis protein [Rhizobacter sp.]|nr:PhzF family phenazine biosynthesis protein [Ferruginibacter sp.]